MLFLPIIKSLELPPLYNSFICIVVRALCYIGSGDLNIIQEFLHILSEHIKDEDKGILRSRWKEPSSPRPKGLFVWHGLHLHEWTSFYKDGLPTVGTPSHPVRVSYQVFDLGCVASHRNLVPVIYGILSPSSLNQSLLDIILRRSASLDSSGV